MALSLCEKMSAYSNVGLFTSFRLQVYDKEVQSTPVKGEKMPK